MLTEIISSVSTKWRNQRHHRLGNAAASSHVVGILVRRENERIMHRVSIHRSGRCTYNFVVHVSTKDDNCDRSTRIILGLITTVTKNVRPGTAATADTSTYTRKIFGYLHAPFIVIVLLLYFKGTVVSTQKVSMIISCSVCNLVIPTPGRVEQYTAIV